MLRIALQAGVGAFTGYHEYTGNRSALPAGSRLERDPKGHLTRNVCADRNAQSGLHGALGANQRKAFFANLFLSAFIGG